MKRLSENEKSLATFGIGALIGYLMPRWLRNTILLIFFGLLAYGYALNSCAPDKAPVEPAAISQPTESEPSINQNDIEYYTTLQPWFAVDDSGKCSQSGSMKGQSITPIAWYKSSTNIDPVRVLFSSAGSGEAKKGPHGFVPDEITDMTIIPQQYNFDESKTWFSSLELCNQDLKDRGGDRLPSDNEEDMSEEDMAAENAAAIAAANRSSEEKEAEAKGESLWYQVDSGRDSCSIYDSPVHRIENLHSSGASYSVREKRDEKGNLMRVMVKYNRPDLMIETWTYYRSKSDCESTLKPIIPNDYR